LTIEAQAEFPQPKSGLWNVHLGFKATLTYAGGVRVIAWNRYANGIRFEGDKGWVFVSRNTQKTAEDDPIMPSAILPALDAGDRRLLKIPTEELSVRLHESKDHFLDWIDAVVSRRDPVAPAEVGHRSNSACILTHMAMRLKRPLAWDPAREAFVNDPDADRLRARPERDAYSVARAMKSAGMHAALACDGGPS
jgi:hypothetical protein